MSIQQAVQGNITTLSSLKDLLNQITDPLYILWFQKPGCSIGQQVRHALEHYQLLFNGLESSRICYDDRERDPLIEQSVDVALSVVDSLISKLISMENSADKMLSVACATGQEKCSTVQTETSLTRELLFIQNHTIHHLAIIAILLHNQSVTVPDDFGVAPATLQFRPHSNANCSSTGSE